MIIATTREFFFWKPILEISVANVFHRKHQLKTITQVLVQNSYYNYERYALWTENILEWSVYYSWANQ